MTHELLSFYVNKSFYFYTLIDILMYILYTETENWTETEWRYHCEK